MRQMPSGNLKIYEDAVWITEDCMEAGFTPDPWRLRMYLAHGRQRLGRATGEEPPEHTFLHLPSRLGLLLADREFLVAREGGRPPVMERGRSCRNCHLPIVTVDAFLYYRVEHGPDVAWHEDWTLHDYPDGAPGGLSCRSAVAVANLQRDPENPLATAPGFWVALR